VSSHSDPSRSVYPLREDSELLRSVVRASPGARVIEVGCGRGPAALTAAAQGARVVATDLNPHALAAVRHEARRRQLTVEVLRTDLLLGTRRFDLIYSNPPYLPTPPELEEADPWDRLALSGGPSGLTVTTRVLATVPEHLQPGGVAFVVFSSIQDPEVSRSLLDGWLAAGGSWGVEAERRLADGEVLRVLRFER
jgi:release factor glutamine methyltransferase